MRRLLQSGSLSATEFSSLGNRVRPCPRKKERKREGRKAGRKEGRKAGKKIKEGRKENKGRKERERKEERKKKKEERKKERNLMEISVMTEMCKKPWEYIIGALFVVNSGKLLSKAMFC